MSGDGPVILLGHDSLGRQRNNPFPVLLLLFLEVVENRIEVVIELASVGVPDSANLLYDRVAIHHLVLHELFWRADDRCFKSGCPADAIDPVPYPGIRNMGAIPSEKVIHAAYDCDGDMESIENRRARHCALMH